MKPTDHSRQLELVMTYVDGALDAAAAENVRRHIGGCAECRQAEQELRGLSDRLQSWEVGEAPRVLRVPAAAAKRHGGLRGFLSGPLFGFRSLAVAAAGVAVVLAGSIMLPQERRGPAIQGRETFADVPASAGSEVTRDGVAERELQAKANRSTPVASRVGGAVQSPVAGAQPAGGPMIVRTARLTIVAADYEAARGELERIVQRAGGFIGQIVAHGAANAPRRLEATLRVPTGKLDETVAALRRLGRVVTEAQDGEDVAQQSADLNTRLENARVAEKRLRDILGQRTGKLSDVLDVEREISRVRGEIEQMESERRSLDRRITYATVAVSLGEDRKSEVTLGPVPLSRRFRDAFVDGWTAAIGSGVAVMLFLVRVAPALLLWAVLIVPAALFLRRRRRLAGVRS